MNNKKISLIGATVAIPLVIFGIFMGIQSDGLNTFESDTIPVFIPSDITKANPSFVVLKSHDLWATTDVKDVANDVVYTIQGEVTSIGDPVDWDTGNTIVGEAHIIGLIPVNISVESVYKGDLTDSTFTFYLVSTKINDQYRFFEDTAQFETGEKILVHLAHYQNSAFTDGHYYPVLEQFSKYQLLEILTNDLSTATSGEITSNDVSNQDVQADNSVVIAYNIHHPNGVILSSISGEALP